MSKDRNNFKNKKTYNVKVNRVNTNDIKTNNVKYNPDTPEEYLDPLESERFEQDPYTVAQNFIDRTQFPLG